jgi:hypothetical protein
LAVRKRRARRKAIGTRTPILVEAKVNARWSLDFIHDQLACGRRFRIFNVVDDVTRECLMAMGGRGLCGSHTKRERLSNVPVEQLIQYQTMVNLKIAELIGVEIPLQMKQIADELIETIHHRPDGNANKFCTRSAQGGRP